MIKMSRKHLHHQIVLRAVASKLQGISNGILHSLIAITRRIYSIVHFSSGSLDCNYAKNFSFFLYSSLSRFAIPFPTYRHK